MRSDPLTVFYRRQTTGVHRTNSDAVVVGENVSENNGLDLCSGELVCRDWVDLLLLYAKDHYDIGDVPSTAEIIISEGDTRYNSDCIYGENKEDPDIAGNYVICGGCRARIESYSDRFNH